MIPRWQKLANLGLASLVAATLILAPGAVHGQATSSSVASTTPSASASSTTSAATALPTCAPAFDCSTAAQPCINNGTCVGKTCSCLPGFGGDNCSKVSCNSPLIAPSLRTLATNGSCTTCDNGFGGFNCNVCQTDAACNTKAPSRTSFLGNENMVCNKAPEVFYESYMTCLVKTPELTSLFSSFTGDYSLTVDMDAKNGTMNAQFWQGSTEQFYCSMPTCTTTTTNTNGLIETKWNCPVLNCVCIKPTMMCGGIPGQVVDLGNTVNSLKGPFTLTCPHNNQNACQFFIGDLAGFFPQGLSMVDCDMGECVFPSEEISSLTNVAVKMAPGIIACLAIIGTLVLALILICVVAKKNQIRLSRTPYTLNTEAASLEFRNVGYTLNSNGMEILKGISGSAPAGVVLAVMGPSGAGKSTLVDILAGKRKDGKVSGQILLNGKQVHESDIRRAVGFVDQEDTLPATQTVREAVMFSAMLRLPEAMPIHKVNERVDEVIEMLGLTGVSDRRIGNVTSRGISGGEKRRVSIALELITRPPILILDEPTSGLDSYSARMVVEQLCQLARGKTTTVILTIHQPRSDIFAMFDQALVVSKGEALYFGSTSTAAQYFNRRGLPCPANYNIADYLLDIAMDPELVSRSKSYREDLHEIDPKSTGLQTHMTEAVSRRGPGGSNGTVTVQSNGSSMSEKVFETSVRMEGSEEYLGGNPNEHQLGQLASSGSSTLSSGHNFDSETTKGKRQKTVYPTSFLTQLGIIARRDAQTLIRDKSLLVLHLGVAIVLGVFIGGLYFQIASTLGGFQNRAGSLFFMLALLGFSSISALGAFTETRTLFIKERSNGYYPPLPFIISTLLFDLIPLRIIPALILGCISYWMIGLSPVITNFLKFLLILVLFNMATGLFCLVIAAGVRTTGVASLASSIIMLFMMLFGGFLINTSQIPAALTWIQYFSMFKYGFEALAVNEVSTSRLIDSIQGVAFDVPGSLILQKLFGFDLTGFWRNMICLLGFCVLFMILFWTLVTLRLKERK